MFPENDTEFRDLVIEEVKDDSIRFNDGWSIFLPSNIEFTITSGMSARQYGKGIGYSVRGLFIEGKKIWYRTEAEDEIHQSEQLYGKNASEWLERWDSGRSVWSLEMGGLGPGYEQCIQITAAEVVRICLARNYDHCKWGVEANWKADRADMDDQLKLVKGWDALGLSGAQYGGAISLGTHIYRQGPIAVFGGKENESRKIQVSKNFPHIEAVA
jgi:hypothetical protein